MPDITTALGLVAAGLTSLAYLPQVQKALPRNSTDNLSLKMLLALLAGLSLWIVYGAVIGDVIIVAANLTGAALVATVLACKIRDMRSA
jgi:MtN3 and saliva related transmembrane protein